MICQTESFIIIVFRRESHVIDVIHINKYTLSDDWISIVGFEHYALLLCYSLILVVHTYYAFKLHCLVRGHQYLSSIVA